MAIPELFKVTKTRYVDADGKRCNKSDPDAIKVTEKLADWYADIKPAESATERIERRKAGLPAPKRQRVKLCSNKRAAQEMLRELIDSGARQAAGIQDYQASANEPLGPLFNSFGEHLRKSGKQRTGGYIDTTLARISKVFTGCGFIRLSDIDCQKIERWLHDHRNAKSKIKSARVRGKAKSYQDIAEAFGVSITTVTYWRRKGAPIVPRKENSLPAIAKWYAEFTRPKAIGSTTNDHYITALKRFGNWLVDKAGKVAENPFDKLDKMNDDTELRKQRRVIDADQFNKLITAATESPQTFRGLNGIDRATIYTLAAYTGLRASEIGSLKTNSFDFGDSPTVTVKAAYTKNKKTAKIPLRSDLAQRLSRYIDQQPRALLSIATDAVLVWPGNWTDDGAEMIRIDLQAAGIPYTDDHGKDYDFHALRHQFITNMARAGVSLKAAQQLARHSKPELTANIYTHLSDDDNAANVEKLDAIPTGTRDQEQAQKAKSTGTDDARAVLGQQWGQQDLINGVISGDKPAISVFAESGENHKKSPQILAFAGDSQG